MKIFLLFFTFLLSTNTYSLTICIDGSGNPDSCVDQGTSKGEYIDAEMACSYVNGVTSCVRIDTAAFTEGIWDSLTSSCSNYVAPVIKSTGITCPAQKDVKIPNNTVVANPSKDDIACDPTKGESGNCASQTTAIKTNDLISESNSKLGSIASSNATNSSLLSNILNTLRGIASQGTPSSSPSNSSGSGSSGSSGSGNGSDNSSGSGTNSLSTDTKNIPKISPSMSNIGICPSPETFNVAGISYVFSYESICHVAEAFHGLVISMAALSSLLIVVTAL